MRTVRIVKKTKLGVVRLSSQGKQQNQSFQQTLQNNTCLYDKALRSYCNLNHVFIFVTIPTKVPGPYQSSNFNPNHNVSLNLTKVFFLPKPHQTIAKADYKWIQFHSVSTVICKRFCRTQTKNVLHCDRGIRSGNAFSTYHSKGQFGRLVE